MCYTQSRFNALLSACVLSLIATAGWSQSLTWLGTLPGGYESYAYGVSADGAVVVGWADNAAGQDRAFRWTASGGMQDLGTLGGEGELWAYGVSADGAVVVGWARNAAGFYRAFRWTASGGMQDLGTLGGVLSVAYGVSADGAVVVGWVRRACLSLDGVGRDAKPRHAGRRWERAYGVSADGSVVVGGLTTPQGRGVPFAGRRLVGCKTSARWAALRARLMVFPPTAPWWSAGLTTPQGRGVPFAGRRGACKTSARWADTIESEAFGVSADGSVVVGWAGTPQGFMGVPFAGRRRVAWKT
jgi:probable HAF family extracellular repeat protein